MAYLYGLPRQACWMAVVLSMVVSACSMHPVKTQVMVRQQDTLYTIARRNNITVLSLIRANKSLRPPYSIYPGTFLRLPKPLHHKVKKGDTLYSISRQYNINLKRLASANNLPHPYTIFTGQNLYVGGGQKTYKSAANKSAAKRQQPKKTSPPTYAYKKPSIAAERKGKKFIWPVQGKILSHYGSKNNGLHNDGINIGVAPGANVKASGDGVVIYVGNELKGYGNLLLIRHHNGWITAYAHTSKILVTKGTRVQQGQVVAKAGSTGSVRRVQLHFEIRKGRYAVNPEKILI